MKALLTSIILALAAPAAMANGVMKEVFKLPLLALVLTGTLSLQATAQNVTILAKNTEMLRSSDHGELMRAATAACLMAPKDRRAVLAILQHAEWNMGGDAGWNVGDDDEWLEIDHKDVWVTMIGTNEEYFCDIQGDIPQSAALASVKDLLAEAGWNDWTITQEDGECHSLTHPDGIGIYITSSGNDPVCTPTPHSAIRISGQEG